ncbi:PEP-CTERM sorting domain-containing protein [Leptolyngbyaceae cyanobacterium UHCC 1019]
MTMMKKLSLTIAGTIALSTSSLDPASAVVFKLSGTTGSAQNPEYSHFYPEYQNARYEGFFIIPDDAPDLDPSHKVGLFEIQEFTIKLFNDHFPTFKALFTQGSTKAFFRQDDTDIFFPDFEIGNTSQNDPTLGSLFLSFNGIVESPNILPTFGPITGHFASDRSFLKVGDSESAPDMMISVTSTSVEAVPEPTTMVGAAVFGLGMLLKKRTQKQ